MFQSRVEFLQTALVPVSDPKAQDCDACPICTGEELTTPISLPCHKTHIFCKACITEWLSSPLNSTCPSCRTKLFFLENNPDWEDYTYNVDARLEEDPEAEYLPSDPADRNETIVQALFMSGLSPHSQGNANMDTFDLRDPFTSSDIPIDGLIRAVSEADSYLRIVDGFNQRGEPRVRYENTAGPTRTQRLGWVRARSLTQYLVAMARLISVGLAIQMDRPFTEEGQQDWRIIVRVLGEILAAHDGELLEVGGLYRRLEDRIWYNHRAVIYRTEFFGLDGRRSPDLNVLLGLVAYQAWLERQGVLRRRERDETWGKANAEREMQRQRTRPPNACPQQGET